VVSVTGVTAGGHPTVVFTVADGLGFIDNLKTPTPLNSPSGYPRTVSRLRITISGPTADYQTGNAPLSELPAVTLVADASHQYTYTFTGALPATASGIWAVGMESRRATALPAYDTAHDTFTWPYTGESVTEYADNPVHYVDSAVGTFTAGEAEAAPRRQIIERARCQKCHLDLNLHGGTRHNPEYCVLCHAPDTTDWPARPKDPSGNTNLATVFSPTVFGTYDNIEERSVHFKTLIHRIHTGSGQGTAAIVVNAPFVVSGVFFDDVRFPNRLSNCAVCHLGNSFTVDAVPKDAQPTRANESATIVHSASATHPASEGILRPIKAACISCHGNPFAYAHADQYTALGVEQCSQCHSSGALSVATVHGVSITP
jgi:OmcA/MtrC family decaheme c-type cytochrome